MPPLLLVLISVLVVKSYAMVYQEPINIKDLELIFSKDECIDGTLSVTETGPAIHPVVFSEPVLKSKENSTYENGKSPMSMLNELAVFNKIAYQYILTEEEGPAHHKQFVITLQLGQEKYVGEGSSIKNAQHTAARLALKTTEYQHPPDKPVTDKIHKVKKNPIQKLEEFVSKHWDVSIKYKFRNKYNVDSSKYHPNFYHNNLYSEPQDQKVTVQIGQHSFFGKGITTESAKQNAAKNALQSLQNIDGFCSFENGRASIWNDLEDSPISQINEFAFKSKMQVIFDVLDEEGPAHMKVFTIKCNVGDKFESFGKGPNKKSAKKEAALKMINVLKEQAFSANCGDLLKKTKTIKKRKPRNLIKSVTNEYSEIKPKLQFPDDINPISKLMEIQQISYNSPPIFTLLKENVETNKQFSIQVKVGDLSFVGSGPNKKSAKRKAAEGMLKMLGYSGTFEELKDSFFGQKRKEFSTDHSISKKKPLTTGIMINSETFIKFDQNKESSYIKSKPTNENNKYEPKGNAETPKNKVKSNFKTPQTQLDNISQTMRFRFQFSNFPKSNNGGFVSLLSLTTDPPKVCFGTGTTIEIAQDNAASIALKDLYKSHLEAISDILRQPTIDDDVPEEDWYNVGSVTIQEESIT